MEANIIVLLFMENYCYQVVWCNHYVDDFFETSVWKEVGILCPFLHNNITMLLIPKVQNKASTSYIYLKNFICW